MKEIIYVIYNFEKKPILEKYKSIVLLNWPKEFNINKATIITS